MAGHGEAELRKHFALIVRAADEIARRCRLDDLRDDLSQAAFAYVLGRARTGAPPMSRSTLEQYLTEAAHRERRRRHRERGNVYRIADVTASKDARRPDPTLAMAGEPLQPAAKGVPTLCPRLHMLVSGTSHAHAVQVQVVAACVLLSRDRAVLDAARYRLFDMAYVRGMTASDIARHAKAGHRAITERLRRISEDLELALLRALQEHTHPETWLMLAPPLLHVTLSEKNENFLTRLNAATCDALRSALGVVIHRIT